MVTNLKSFIKDRSW